MQAPTRRIALAAALIAVIPTAAHAIDAKLPSPGGGTLVMLVPDGWRQGSRPGRSPTIAFQPPADEAFLVLASTFVPRTGPTTQAALRKLMDKQLAQAQAKAVEPALVLQELRGGAVQGLYFTATDKAPKPGEYKTMTQGAFLARGMPVMFTILTNDDSKPAVELALRMFAAAHRK